MSSFLERTSCALIVAAAAAMPVRAQNPATPAQSGGAADSVTLTLREAQRLAVRQNPSFLADAQASAIARAQLRQARLPAFNPEAEVRLPGLATGGGAGDYELALMQNVEWAGQRGLRSAAGRQGVSRADFGVRNAARLAVVEASIAFYTALAAQRRLALAEEALVLNERLQSAVRIQLREGEISALESNLAEIEGGRARARVLAARRELTAAEADLRIATGLGGSGPLRLVDEVPPAPSAGQLQADSLVAFALVRRPDLAEAQAGMQELETLTRLARREALPAVRVGVVAERADGEGDPRVGIGVGMAIPLLNRNQGRIAERRAEAEQASLRRRAVEARVQQQVVQAARAYAAASEEAAVYETAVLQPARENRALLETAYRAGKIDLPTLLLVRNQLLDAEAGYWDAWLARRRALAELEAAIGTLPADLQIPLETVPPSER